MRRLARLVFLSAFAASAAAGPPDPEEAAYPAIRRFVEVLETVRHRHPEADLVSYDRLVNHALEGMLAGLDPHSSFIHPEMATLLREQPDTDPELRPLGLTLGLRGDGPYVAAVAPAGPAAAAGIRPGSALLAIDGRALDSGSFSDWLATLDRPPGSRTRLLLRAPSEPAPQEHELVHRLVEDRSVIEARLLDVDPPAGYIRLASFGRGCAAEMEAAADDLEDRGIKRLILDLRGNGGGDLHETVRILGLWLPPDTAVVTTRGRDPEANPDAATLRTPDRKARERDYPLAVLIDRHSASASELTAGALQDLERATIIGETSYGKGSVQNIIPTGGGTALRLTVATYHTPSGSTPHRHGITPDRPVPLTDADRDMHEKRGRLDSLPAAERREADAWDDPAIKAAL